MNNIFNNLAENEILELHATGVFHFKCDIKQTKVCIHLPVALCGCLTWCPAIKQWRRLKVSENK